MRCTRKKPECCFNCTLPDCIDDGNSTPDKSETAYLEGLFPEHKIYRTKARIEYEKEYFRKLDEEKKQKRRERALEYYRKHKNAINARKREMRLADA